MTLPNNAQARIGGVDFMLDEGYEAKTGRRPYNHYGRHLFSPRTNIDGKPGAQNLNPDNLNWQITDFAGEGRVVYDPDNPGLFYRSEGLNFRVPGEFSLNRSVTPTTILDSAAASATLEGNAGFADVSGTSTTSGTDRRLVALTNSAAATQNPGANRVQLDFYLYAEPWETYRTQILGSAMKQFSGDGHVSGTTYILGSRSIIRTVPLSTGTAFTAGVRQRVDFDVTATSAGDAGFFIMDVTEFSNPKVITSNGRFGTNFSTLNFTPVAGHIYQFRVADYAQNRTMTFNQLYYGPDSTANTVTIAAYDNTPTLKTSQTITVTAAAAGALVGTLVITGTNANWTYRVTRVSGAQAVWIDKVVTTAQSAATWTLSGMELGLDGDIYLIGTKTATDSNAWTFAESTNTWTKGGALTGSSGSACYAMAHSDKYEYCLMSDNKVYYTDNASVHTAYTTNALTVTLASSVAVGMTIAQDRIFVLAEDAVNGVIVRTLPVDGTAGTWASLILGTVTVSTAKIAADVTQRQRMCSSPTGARFYINYSDVTSKIYETDSSGSSLVAKELADLGHGVRATAIAYEGGITFITGVFQAETDQTPRSALWIIDQNGVLQRVGFFRYDNPDANAPCFITPYQTNLYMLQGSYLWRYSLTTGGLFLEYQLSPQDATQARALAVTQGRTFALYGDDGAGTNSSEVWVSGVSGTTYRQGGFAQTNQFVSSIYDYELPGFKKLLVSAQVLTDTMPSNTSVRVEYQIDQSGTWVLLGTAVSGTISNFPGASADTPVTFNTIQLRVTPASLTGSATPVVHAIILKSLPAEAEEFFDLVLRTEDADSSDHIDGEQMDGDEKASAVYQMWKSKTPVTFSDGYAFKDSGVAPDYLVVVDDFRDERILLGEGRVVCTLRVVL